MESWRKELYLSHHGIKGQKWGQRNYQYEDGSLTPEGKKRYRGKNNKKTRREKLADSYQKKGYSRQEAEKIAAGRVRTERILIGIGAATVAAVSAYEITKYVRNNKDDIIKSGTKLNRVTRSDSASLHGNFYAAHNKGDITKYRGLYGLQLKGRSLSEYSPSIYNKTINVNKNIKIAGNKSAQRIFNDLYKTNYEFRETAKLYGKTNTHGKNIANNNMKKLYENFNTRQMSLTRGDDRSRNAWLQFENALRKAGYSGVKDMNDRKFSGYFAKSANIYFNNPDIFKVSSVKLLSNLEVAKNGRAATYKVLNESRTQKVVGVGEFVGVAATSGAAVQYLRNQRAINKGA